MTVGEIAKRAGVSVRTLYHYEAIGLLTPDGRTEAGYRLYGDAGVVRLQQIRSLRHLGFGLEQIGDLLNRRGLTPLRVIELHLDQLHRQIAAQRQLSIRLAGIAARLRSAGEVSVDDDRGDDQDEELLHTGAVGGASRARTPTRRGRNAPGGGRLAAPDRRGPRRDGAGNRPGERASSVARRTLARAGSGVHRRQSRDRPVPPTDVGTGGKPLGIERHTRAGRRGPGDGALPVRRRGVNGDGGRVDPRRRPATDPRSVPGG